MRALPILRLLLNESPLTTFARWVRVYIGAAISAPNGSISTIPDPALDTMGGWIAEPGRVRVHFAPRAATPKACCCVGRSTARCGACRYESEACSPRPSPRPHRRTVEADEPKSPPVTWVTPYWDAQQAAYGGEMPIGKNVVTLQKLEEKCGAIR